MKNKQLAVTILLILISFQNCNSQHNKKQMTTSKHTNNLLNETSPYLLQHANNPVNWYPWGEEALSKAKEENKMILISVGYSACHWCHVMAHQSFEDEGIAEIMNEHFICIKVDREERPDVDQIYMNAVQLMTGRGGWPLNCFALPDGRPFFGGTYFPKAQWANLLKSLARTWEQETFKITQSADELAKGLKSVDIIEIKEASVGFDAELLTEILDKWKVDFDYEEGGIGGAPKFPLPGAYEFLLRQYYTSKDEKILEFVEITLKKMAYGGIFDQIGGGFARYSVDGEWKVPHFEKMLYDNSQLVSLYSNAYKLTKNELYRDVVYSSLAFVERELSSSENAFYSALDADSEGIEGKFYIWKDNEIDKIIVKDKKLFKDYFYIKERGNWEKGENILLRKEEDAYFMKKYNLSLEELKKSISENSALLLKEREKRERPGLDDKILTSWNALMLIGYLDAYMAFQDKHFLKKAELTIDFILSKMLTEEGSLMRSYKNGEAKISAFLDDYAFTIQALIKLHKATLNEKYLDKALEITEFTFTHFFDKETSMFFYTADTDTELSSRKMDLSDNVLPSSNSVMAINLYTLGFYYDNEKYLETSTQMLSNVKNKLVNYGRFKYNWDYLLSLFVNKPVEIVVTGKKAKDYVKVLNAEFLPGVLIVGSKSKSNLSLFTGRFVKDKSLIYLCEDRVCKLPVEEISELSILQRKE